MNFISRRRRILYNSSGNPVFYLQKIDGSQTLEFEFERGMTWSDFVASDYNEGMFMLDAEGEALLYLEGQFEGSKGIGLLAYNGFVVWLTNDTSTIAEEKFVSTGSNLSTLEAERTYYCDGVGYVPYSISVIDGNGDTSNRKSYVSYNGVNYTIGQSFECNPGDSITCYLYGNWRGCQILLNGTVVATAANPTYTMTVNSNINVEIHFAAYGQAKMYITTG